MFPVTVFYAAFSHLSLSLSFRVLYMARVVFEYDEKQFPENDIYI